MWRTYKRCFYIVLLFEFKIQKQVKFYRFYGNRKQQDHVTIVIKIQFSHNKVIVNVDSEISEL